MTTMKVEGGSEAVPAPNTSEAAGKVRLQYQGEKLLRGEYLLAPEQENIALRAKVTRYSELVSTTVAGFAFCALIDAFREPRDYRGWFIVGILLLVIAGGILVRWRTASEQPTS